MATDTFVNILDLQPITEVVNGDYLIVETPAGTRIINFKDFILPNSNILLAQTVFENTTAILSNFNLMNDYIAALSGSVNGTSNANSTLLNSISSLLRTDINSISSNTKLDFNGLSSDLQTKVDENNLDLSTKINELSSKLYYGTGSITINLGASNGIGTLTPSTTKTLSSQNISITPANAYAAKYPAYISSIQTNNIITITAPFSGAGTAASDAIYNLLAISTA